jgi:putative chitinase
VISMLLQKLKNHLPDSVLEQIPAIAELTTPLRLAHFLSQCSHESNGFKTVAENLNYSASGLRTTFPKYFDNDASSLCARKPEAIANLVYANRMGNNGESSCDGYKYRGRGYLQITGKANYAAFGNFIGVDCVTNPDLIASKYPLLSAAWFFSANGLWAICDKGAGDDIVKMLTRRINGGAIGLDERIRLFAEIWGFFR